MLTVLWSTPRTGSTWYSHFLLAELKKTNPNALFLRQYLSKFQFDQYKKQNVFAEIHSYTPGCFYNQYYLEPLSKKIVCKNVSEERVLDIFQEEAYRIGLLEKVNLIKYPIIMQQHVQPMSMDSYYYLKNKATRNIYIYRENFIDQMASYIVAAYTDIFFRAKGSKEVVVENASIDKARLYDFYGRIKHWHTLDKEDCEIVKFEDIPFNNEGNLQKQHTTKPIHQISQDMKDMIFSLHEEFENFLQELPIQKKNLLP